MRKREICALALISTVLLIGLSTSAAQPAPTESTEADKLNQQVTELYKAGKYSEAIPIATKLVELCEKTFGPEHPNTARNLNILAGLYRATGDYAKAEPLLQRALKIREKSLGPEHPETATTLSNLAAIYYDMGDYAKAEPLYQRALKIREKTLGGGKRGVEKQEGVPEFPWPPPRASASDVIPRGLLVGNVAHPTLSIVAQAIESAFAQAGYGEKSYYSVPGGFAMASQIEQINQDGSPKESYDRWSLEVPPLRKFELGLYLTALFTARPGYFRVIVFIVTSKPFSQSDVKVTPEQTRLWVLSGLNRLPEEIGNQEYTAAHSCTALIYEFKKTGRHAELVDPSQITGKTHLDKSGLMAAFTRQ